MTATTPTRAVQTLARQDPRTDSELLTRFLTHHDQAAFAALVTRHGSLVYGVCRRALGTSADADDAFQATFLVLVKRASAIPWRANLGPWLFGVAHRIAAKARFRRDRRFALEKQVDTMPHPEATSPDRAESDDLSRLFDEELAKLPEEMRRAVVLCELQGLSRQAAAKQLRISEGTLSSRLGRARKKLAAAFTERGVKLVIPASVGVSASLTTATARAACDPVGAVPVGVSYLVQEALKAMTLSKLKIGAVLAAVAVGCSWMAFADEPKKPIALPAAKADEKATPPAKADKPADAVATLNGEDISRTEFGEYLIRKYGAKEIELFVNKKLIEQTATKAKVNVSEKELDAELAADLKDISVTKDDFVKVVLPKYGKTESEWREDVLRPRLLLAKLPGEELTATDDDLKKLFERKYGEKREVEVFHLPKTDTLNERWAKAVYADGLKNIAHLDPYVVQVSVPGRPDSRTMTFNQDQPAYGGDKVSKATFAMKDVGALTELLPVKDGWCVVKLMRVIPAVEGKTFANEKAELRTEAEREKVQAGIPKLFAKMKEEAKPVYHIKPEPKTFPQPVPIKK